MADAPENGFAFLCTKRQRRMSKVAEEQGTLGPSLTVSRILVFTDLLW